MFKDVPADMPKDKILAGLEQDIAAAEYALQQYKKEQVELDQEFQKIQRRVEALSFQIKQASIGETQNLLQKMRNDILNALPADQSLKIKMEDVKATIMASNIDDTTRSDLMEHLIELKGRLNLAQKPYALREQKLLDDILSCKNKRAIHIAKVYVATIREQFIEKFNDMHIGWQNIDSDTEFSAEIERDFKGFRPYYDDAIHKKLVVAFISNAILIVQKYQDSFEYAVLAIVKNISDDDLHDATELDINNVMKQRIESLFSQAEDRINQDCVGEIYNLKRQVMKDIGTKYLQAKIAKCDEFMVLLNKPAFDFQQSTLKTDLRLIRKIQNEHAYYFRKKELYTAVSALNLEGFDVLYKKLKVCTILLNKLYKAKKSSYIAAIGLKLFLEEDLSSENKKISQLALEICKLEIKQQESKFVMIVDVLKRDYALTPNFGTMEEVGLASKVADFTSQIFDARVSYVDKLRSLHKNISAMFKISQEQNEPNMLSGEKIAGLIVAKVSELNYLKYLKEYYALYMTIATQKLSVIDPKTAAQIILLHLQIFCNFFKTEEVAKTISDKSVDIEELNAALEAYKDYNDNIYKELQLDANKADFLPSLAALLQIARLLNNLPKHPILNDFDSYLEEIIKTVKSHKENNYSDWRTEDYDGTAHESDEEIDESIEESVPDSDDAYSIDEIEQEQADETSEVSDVENNNVFYYESDKASTPLLPVPDTPTSTALHADEVESATGLDDEQLELQLLLLPDTLNSTESQSDEIESETALDEEQLTLTPSSSRSSSTNRARV